MGLKVRDEDPAAGFLVRLLLALEVTTALSSHGGKQKGSFVKASVPARRKEGSRSHRWHTPPSTATRLPWNLTGSLLFRSSLASLQVTWWCAFSSAASTDDEMSTHESLFCLFSHFIWLLQFPALLWNSRVYAVLIVIWLGPLKRLLQRYETKLWLRVVICFSFVRYFRLVRGLLFLLCLHYSSKRKRFPLFLRLPHALPCLLFRSGSHGREESLPSSLLELIMDNWDGTNFIFDWSSRGWTSFVLL